MLEEKDLKTLVKMIISSRAERQILETQLLSRLQKYVTSTTLSNLQIYLKSINLLVDNGRAIIPISNTPTETLAETILQQLPTVMKETQALQTRSNQELAFTLLQLVNSPTFYNYHFSLPPSMIRSLERISKGLQPYESTVKAKLALEPRLRINRSERLPLSSHRQLNNSGKWQIVK